ncbi:MAG: hypothetical protein ACI9NT_001237 [Bacteroidia bacterium]|jgi:hypothetical protein
MSLNYVLSRALLGLALAMGVCQLSFADAGTDEVQLLNGSRIVGTVTGVRDGVVSIETDFAGTLSISLDQVESMQTAATTVLLMSDDSLLEDAPLLVQEGQLVLDGGAAYPLSALSVANPEPWELGQGYKWSGLANLALVMQRGNTDTDEADYKLESVWLSTQDRYTLQWHGETDEVNGEKSADNWQVTGKYDYFLADPNYVGVRVFAEHDKFADLDLRSLIGPYVGRLFYSEPVFTLSAELGASYVDEDFKVAEDDNYVAANWAINVTSDYLGGDSRLYFDQTGVWNIEDTGDVIVNSTFGLAFPLLWNFEAAAEAILEYNAGAVDNVDDLDETYRLRVGYTW